MGRCDHCGGKGPLWTRVSTLGCWVLCQDCRIESDRALVRWVTQLEGPFETRGLTEVAP